MRNKYIISIILAAVLMLALAGGALASQGQDNLMAFDWENGKTRVGWLEKAGMQGYDFVLVSGSSRILIMPAGPGISARLSANLNSRVMLHGRILPERFTQRKLMEVTDVRPLDNREFAEKEKFQNDYDQSVSDNVYGTPGPEVEEPVDQGNFNDLAPDHWARNAVREMAKRKILTGMGNNKFEPNAQVTRAQFATMLVKGLGLPFDESSGQTFTDVGPQDWSYKFVEAAKDYLTGYKSASGGVLFHPHMPAVREDMAVAIVKARGLSPATDLSVLDSFSDSQLISENLRPYVAAAVNAGLMRGYENGAFRPQGKLTRAEAAVLMYKVIQAEKVVM